MNIGMSCHMRNGGGRCNGVILCTRGRIYSGQRIVQRKGASGCM